MNQKIKNPFFLLFLLCMGQVSFATEEWVELMEKKKAIGDVPLITNRAVTKAGKWQVVGPLIGNAERADFHTHFPVTLGVRKFFAESHAWEVLRINYDMHSLTDIATDVTVKTGYVVDASQADFSISSGYVYAPLYGKYAFSENHLIHFDGYVGFSLGMRFARSLQFSAEPFIGFNHYFTPSFAIVFPEIRLKAYTEARRSGSEFVTELVGQMGVSWLF